MRLHLSVLAIAIVGVSVSAAQDDLPTRRAGLWEITINYDDPTMPPLVVQHCTDVATDKLMNAFGGEMSAAKCSKREIQKAGATIIINAVCQVEPIKWVSQTVISGDFNSHYTVRVTSKVEGLPKSWEPLFALAVGPYTMQARWVGACKADQLPGDIILADGSKTNIKEVFK